MYSTKPCPSFLVRVLRIRLLLLVASQHSGSTSRDEEAELELLFNDKKTSIVG